MIRERKGELVMAENYETTESVSDNEQSAEMKEKKKNSMGREIFEWFYTIVIAVVIAFGIKTFLFDIVKVDGNSMYPTLHHKDRLVVTKLGYEPKQGDIIILDSTYKEREAYYDRLEEETGKEFNAITKFFKNYSLPQDLKKKYYVKRVIGMPGQTVDIRDDGKVYVDGQVLEEAYYQGETFTIDPNMEFPLTVEEDMVFVMGDNRGHSLDSRSTQLGLVPYEAVMGKSQLRIFPLNSIGTTK